MPEAWLSGPVEGIDPYLMPAAHALLQAREELERAATGLDAGRLWARPAGAASVGFHLRHVAGVVDRLLAYARGEALSAEQLAALKREGDPGEPPATGEELVAGVRAAVSRALDAYRAIPREALLEPRSVGRAGLPSNVLGLLFHLAEHSQRHAGQALTTAKVVSG